MCEQQLNRLLDLVRERLGATEAHLELGGTPSESALEIWCSFAGARMVARFAEAPSERELKTKKLSSLCGTFADTIRSATNGVYRYTNAYPDARGELETALTALARRAGATDALVSDLNAPILWAVSQGPTGDVEKRESIESCIRELNSEHSDKLKQAHGHTLRLELQSGRECLTRLFGGTYVVTLCFDEPLSEPVALGALLHAMPGIEKLVLALPPVDPPPGGKVIRLQGRMRSV